ncbi:MAG: hypothetical protein U0441_36565 [Polyangiaceae bacterium]
MIAEEDGSEVPCRAKRGVPQFRSALSRSLAGTLVLGGVLFSFSACRDASADSAATSSTAAADKPSSGPKSEEPKPESAAPQPVYPRTNDAPDPLAKRFCDAIHTLPARRKAECCGGDPSVTLADECARTLSFALRSKAISLDASSVAQCEEAAAKAHEGCDWVSPLASPAPAACLGVVKGALQEGDRCRSSLECTGDLHCHGVAASDTGKCGKPKASGACSRGIDTLASHVLDATADADHPECAGHCNGRRCEADLPDGAACTTAIACGEGHSCVDHRCSYAPLPSAGEKCLGGACGGGARCVAGTCAAPKNNGETCVEDAECKGACDRSKGGPTGVCAMLCAARIPMSTKTR